MKDGFLGLKAKGVAGYIDSKKRFELLMALVLLIIAAGIFVMGLALNKWEKGNIFTVIAALFVQRRDPDGPLYDYIYTVQAF